MTDTSTVSVEVLSLDRMAGRGRLLGIASVELVIDGVTVGLAGVQVLRTGTGLIEAALPRYRSPAGLPVPAVLLPPELEEAVLRAVLGEASRHPVIRVPSHTPGEVGGMGHASSEV